MKPTSIWKARESLAGAESERTHRRFNNYTRDAYYACFQAATAALLNEGISPTLRRTLTDLLGIRDKADYWVASVCQREAAQAVRRAQEFVHEVKAHRLPPEEP
jgi:uncharacterized protein (UPF0332 family)